MKTKVLKCLKYLHSYRSMLNKRSIQRGTGQQMVTFRQGLKLTRFNGAVKLVGGLFSLMPRFGYEMFDDK
jgi:hypothetical protein